MGTFQEVTILEVDAGHTLDPLSSPESSRRWATSSENSGLFRLTRLYMMMAQKFMAPKIARSLQNICSKSEALVHIRGPYSASFCTQSSKLKPKQLGHDHR